MNLKDSDVLVFQQLCKSELDMDLAWGEAQALAIGLVRLMKVTYKPMTIKEYEALNNEYEEHAQSNSQASV